MKIYEQWLDVSNDLRKLKIEELRLRNKINATILEEKLEGSVTITKPNYKVTGTARLNRVLNAEILDAIWEDLTPDEQESVQFKPSLVLANYKQIELSGGKLMEAVTVKPGQASLKIERLGE